MAPANLYELTTTNKKRTKAIVKPSNTPSPIFDLDLSWCMRDLSPKKGQHSIVMRSLSSPSSTSEVSGNGDAPVIGTCDLSFKSLSNPIHLGLGDPESAPESVIREDLRCTKKWMTNGFELSVDLGRGRGGSAGNPARMFDWLHLKMVEQGSQRVVARFVHNPLWGCKRGVFELEEYDGGQDWDKIVILSGSAVLEYLRKMSGYSY
ncbi:hypothetical protein H2203_006474 [Taxawa tesnikishii (nom. ined.)]|nr:hypothetical protein H2203_006474 [Dothideales sp. JES 119]